MREIKFRALIENSDGHGEVQTFWEYYAPLDDPWWTDGTLKDSRVVVKDLQYTGLKDKNGKEIYEGDVVECRGSADSARTEEKYGADANDWPRDVNLWVYNMSRDVVTMDRFPVFWLKKESFGYEGENLVNVDYCTVIGNIYENPELVKP